MFTLVLCHACKIHYFFLISSECVVVGLIVDASAKELFFSFFFFFGTFICREIIVFFPPTLFEMATVVKVYFHLVSGVLHGTIKQNGVVPKRRPKL